MLTKSDIQALERAGYFITVAYTSTNEKTADVNLDSLFNAEDTDDLEFEHDEIEEESFDIGSENYSIWSRPNADGISHCVADGLLDYDQLETAIIKILNNLKKEG